MLGSGGRGLWIGSYPVLRRSEIDAACFAVKGSKPAWRAQYQMEQLAAEAAGGGRGSRSGAPWAWRALKRCVGQSRTPDGEARGVWSRR